MTESYHPANPYRIFIVEDDDIIASSLVGYAKQWGFVAGRVWNFQHVLEEADDFMPHLILLDVGLPFHNGYYWCSEIRKKSHVPIIFISSETVNMNIVLAMNMGGDDYITKPFDLMVLMTKIQAILRRSYDYGTEISVMEHRGAILNLSDGTLSYNNKKIELSKNEFRILHCLMENKNKIVSREKLMEALWKTDCYIDENTLTVNVGRLRKKLESEGLTDFITTKVGMGYLLE